MMKLNNLFNISFQIAKLRFALHLLVMLKDVHENRGPDACKKINMIVLFFFRLQHNLLKIKNKN